RAFSEQLAASFGTLADMRLPVGGIGGAAGHNDLDKAILIVIAVPGWAKRDDFLVQGDADLSVDAYDHPLAFQRFEPRLEVTDEILGDKFEAFARADDSFDAGPCAVELFLLFLGIFFGKLRDLGIKLALFRLRKLNPR